jgi:hypothetical protein
MNKEYLPFFDNLEQKYKDIYMEWSKEQLIDHLVANIKNGEVLLSRIEKAVDYLNNTPRIVESTHYRDKESNYAFVDFEVKGELLNILKGETK